MGYNNVKSQLAPAQTPVDVEPTNCISLEDNRYEFKMIIF